LGEGANIDAVDLSRRKLDLLEDTTRRLGIKGVRAIEADMRAPGSAVQANYDVAVLDAPCSGLGVLRRHPEIKVRTKPTLIDEMAKLQRELLDSVAARVGKGGQLVYAVCTFSQAEGPGQIADFLRRHSDFAVEPPTGKYGDWPQVVGADGTVRTWPHNHDADAFFAARLRRL
jgi:16S rRNA (cytosine967-C5)-methyltransferase